MNIPFLESGQSYSNWVAKLEKDHGDKVTHVEFSIHTAMTVNELESAQSPFVTMDLKCSNAAHRSFKNDISPWERSLWNTRLSTGNNLTKNVPMRNGMPIKSLGSAFSDKFEDYCSYTTQGLRAYLDSSRRRYLGLNVSVL